MGLNYSFCGDYGSRIRIEYFLFPMFCRNSLNSPNNAMVLKTYYLRLNAPLEFFQIFKFFRFIDFFTLQEKTGFIKTTDYQPTTHRPTDPPSIGYPPTHRPTDPPTHRPTDPPTHRPTDPPTHRPTHRPLTHRLTDWLSLTYIKIEDQILNMFC